MLPVMTGQAVYVMTHLDVPPPFFAQLQPTLHTYIDTLRQHTGLRAVNVLQHVSPRQNHLTIMEAWSSREALEQQRRDPTAVKFQSTIVPLLGALYDERLYRTLDATK